MTELPLSEQEEHTEYENRVIAFCDILGWSELIGVSEHDPSLVQRLADMTEQAPHWAKLIDTSKAQGDKPQFGIEVAHFSDTIVVSCRNEPSGITTILKGTSDLINGVLQQGSLCRGAITTGKLYHRGNILFGPALNSAYKMEKELAIYPRILVADNLVATLGNSGEHTRYVRQDSDGCHFLDVFSGILPGREGEETANIEWSSIRFQEFRKNIENGMRRCGTDPKKRMKWNWLVTYFNDVVAKNPDLKTDPVRQGE